jgi:chromosome segregation ATPase
MSQTLNEKSKQKNNISYNINNLEDIINKIKLLNANINKKEDDIKNIINEKDDIIQKINNRLLSQEKELIKSKNEIKNLNELVGKINKENKKKDKILQNMKDKLLEQEKIINEYKNKINGLDNKIIEMKNSQNDYKALNDQIPRKIEKQENNIDGTFHIKQNNINQNLNKMRRCNTNFNLKPKITILFKSEEGDKRIFNFNFGTTLNETFIAYIQRINKTQKINDKDFSFLFNGIKLSFWDNTKIENYFSDCINPTILVFENDKFEKK